MAARDPEMGYAVEKALNVGNRHAEPGMNLTSVLCVNMQKGLKKENEKWVPKNKNTYSTINLMMSA